RAPWRLVDVPVPDPRAARRGRRGRRLGRPARVTHAFAFLGVAVVVIVTPGQDTALTIRNTLAGRRRGGVSTALGVAFGQATWTIAAAAGIAAVLRASEP